MTDHPPGSSHTHSHGGHHGSHPSKQKKPKITEFDMDKLRSTLKQLVRDWSEDVSELRRNCSPTLGLRSL